MLRRLLRETVRNRLHDDLAFMGVDARLLRRGVWMESTSALRNRSREDSSYGVIEVQDSLIAWIHVWNYERWSGGGESGPVMHSKDFATLAVVDERLRAFRPEALAGISIGLRARRKFALVGPVQAITWEGKDSGTGIIDVLNADADSKSALLGSGLYLSVSAENDKWTSPILEPPYSPFWKITTPLKGRHDREGGKKRYLRRIDWTAVDAVARCLFSAELSSP